MKASDLLRSTGQFDTPDGGRLLGLLVEARPEDVIATVSKQSLKTTVLVLRSLIVYLWLTSRFVLAHNLSEFIKAASLDGDDFDVPDGQSRYIVPGPADILACESVKHLLNNNDILRRVTQTLSNVQRSENRE
jgi:hypothetical protein